MRKAKKWIYSDPSVRLPYFMLKSDMWRRLSSGSKDLYIYMRMTMFDTENGKANTNEALVSFGPSDAYGFSRSKYYRSLNELLDTKLIVQVSSGGHGRKSVFDLLTLDWV